MSPTAGVDPRTALATSMHAAPGVYALLLGSGLSSAAGIPTGWHVVQDLVRKVARAEGVRELETEEDPEEWWARTRGATPRYDELLASLAGTDGMRQRLLRTYFDPPPEAAGPILPTRAHQAIARLCAAGCVRVILTTNFDRLLERALDQVGVAPQVIATDGALEGMTPLVHAPATVVKLHGDYTMLGMRNTAEELSDYSEPMVRLLDRVLDEYGLVVAGWSAEYDTALANAIAASPSRRYPTYWTSFHGAVAEPASRLIAQRRATVIDTEGADDLFPDLAERIAQIDRRVERHARPRPLRTQTLSPRQMAPQGWRGVPLLQLRAAAIAPSGALETVGFIGARERDRVAAALATSPLTSRLAAVSDSSQTPSDAWEASPDAHQSADEAVYRLGDDTTALASAIADIQLPRPGPREGHITLTVDIGVSRTEQLSLAEAALLLCDGLVLSSTLLPEALDDVIPPDADVSRVELHIVAPAMDRHGSVMSNALRHRLDLIPFGPPMRRNRPMGFAAHVTGPLSDRAATELVVDGLEHMAYANGYLDPRSGIAALRRELDLDEPGA